MAVRERVDALVHADTGLDARRGRKDSDRIQAMRSMSDFHGMRAKRLEVGKLGEFSHLLGEQLQAEIDGMMGSS